MSNYKFYVYTNTGVIDNLTITQAIAEYKNNSTKTYKAIGVTKDNNSSCDLLNNLGLNSSNKISNDYLYIDKFKNDSLITVNTIGILKQEFNLEV